MSVEWPAVRRTIPTACAVAPVGMLFGTLAASSGWSGLDIVLCGLIGFSGSGQFALLPLATQGISIVTLLLVGISINCRYIPIAFISASRLPKAIVARLPAAHLLGDEAFSLEQDSDAPSAVMAIRLTIYAAWVLSGAAGYAVSAGISGTSFDMKSNFGFPADMVLLYLSANRLISIRGAVSKDKKPQAILVFIICGVFALFLLWALGPIYFWIPSICLGALFSKWIGK